MLNCALCRVTVKYALNWNFHDLCWLPADRSQHQHAYYKRKIKPKWNEILFYFLSVLCAVSCFVQIFLQFRRRISTRKNPSNVTCASVQYEEQGSQKQIEDERKYWEKRRKKQDSRASRQQYVPWNLVCVHITKIGVVNGRRRHFRICNVAESPADVI
jgi:hypothetical protein